MCVYFPILSTLKKLHNFLPLAWYLIAFGMDTYLLAYLPNSHRGRSVQNVQHEGILYKDNEEQRFPATALFQSTYFTYVNTSWPKTPCQIRG